MVKIGLLSDTHGYIDDNMLSFFEQVDEIWHAGDIGPKVMEPLLAFKPVRAVYGNIDETNLRRELKEIEQFQIEQVKVMMVHIGGYPGHYAPGIGKHIAEYRPNLCIAGHSHILKVIYDKKYQCLHLNPGASGISGFHQVRTMLRFTIDGTNITDLDVWEKPRK